MENLTRSLFNSHLALEFLFELSVAEAGGALAGLLKVDDGEEGLLLLEDFGDEEIVEFARRVINVFPL